MDEVGVVYVSVMPTTSGWSRQMDSQLGGAFDGAANKGESKLKGMLGKVAAWGAAALATIGLGKLVKNVVQAGIEYNTLEQTSRAAFKTILGSGEAAATMMAEIKEFAKTSPFPRQAFIKATQQMLAFGFAASDAVPYLSAIQDAVAAAGGGADEITGIVDVLSKVKSTGKITANTLNELGYRGVNAAKLIGAQMGKTEAEIRDSITAGTLDAGDALEALRKGMESTYGGAAENVKKTFVGAVDRIKGATRDIGSALMAPFVDPEGGGYAVEWANKFADVLRAFEGSAAFDKLKEKVGDFGAALDPVVSNAATLLEILLNDGWGAFKDAFSDMTIDVPGFAAIGSFFTTIAPLMPALADAFLAIGPALIEALPALTQLALTVLPAAAAAAPGVIALLEGIATFVGGAGADLTSVADALGEFLGFIGGSFQLMGDLFAVFRDELTFSDIIIGATLGRYGAMWQQFQEDVARPVGAAIGEIWKFAGGVQQAMVVAIAWLMTLPQRVAQIFLGVSMWLYTSGQDLIQGFIDGITSMVGAVAVAMNGVLDWAAGFFPNSPAKRGPFSGSGWTAVEDGGQALLEQFSAGFVLPDAAMSLGVMSVLPDSFARGSSRGDGGSGINQTNNFYEQKTDPRVLLREAGRELKAAGL